MRRPDEPSSLRLLPCFQKPLKQTWPDVFEQGQWYRLLTHMFIHSGAEHILNNMSVTSRHIFPNK